jgi:hypothetical protein
MSDISIPCKRAKQFCCEPAIPFPHGPALVHLPYLVDIYVGSKGGLCGYIPPQRIYGKNDTPLLDTASRAWSTMDTSCVQRDGPPVLRGNQRDTSCVEGKLRFVRARYKPFITRHGIKPLENLRREIRTTKDAGPEHPTTFGCCRRPFSLI